MRSAPDDYGYGGYGDPYGGYYGDNPYYSSQAQGGNQAQAQAQAAPGGQDYVNKFLQLYKEDPVKGYAFWNANPGLQHGEWGKAALEGAFGAQGNNDTPGALAMHQWVNDSDYNREALFNARQSLMAYDPNAGWGKGAYLGGMSTGWTGADPGGIPGAWAPQSGLWGYDPSTGQASSAFQPYQAQPQPQSQPQQQYNQPPTQYPWQQQGQNRFTQPVPGPNRLTQPTVPPPAAPPTPGVPGLRR